MFATARVTPASEEEDEEDEVYQYSKTAPGPVFAAIENILRCAICRAIADPPVALRCCQQAYCSLCIRQHLDSKTPRCPLCRDAAVPSQLVVSRELRAISSLWKKNRKSIVAAAESRVEAHRRRSAAPGGDGGRDSESSGEEPSATPAAGGRGGGAGGWGRGSRHPEKGHSASGAAQERVRAMFYHSMSETALRQKLRELGLPYTGNKAAMVARHKRLVLLDAASADQEVPTPRAELVRQVAAWSLEKDRERKREKKRESVVTFLSTSMLRAWNASTASASASAGGQGQDQDQGTEAVGSSAAATPSIPPEMKQGFAKLVAKMKEQEAARKRTAEAASKGGDGDKVGDDTGGDERRAKRARLGEGGSDNSGTRCDADRRGQGERTVSGKAYEEDGVVEGDSGEAMEILGVEGRMVRTRGPWRCVLLKEGSDGDEGEGSTEQGSSEPALGLGSGSTAEDGSGADGVSESEPGLEARSGSGSKAPSSPSRTTSASRPACEEDSRRGSQDLKGDLQVLASSGSRPNAAIVLDRGSGGLAGASNGVSKDGDVDGSDGRLLGKRKGQPDAGGDERAAGSDAANGSEGLPSATDERIRVAAPASSGTAGEGGVPEAPDAGAVLSEVLTGDEGILYVNQDTGEATRDPPPELVARSEEAEQAGDYLVFVPYRSFWRAVREGGSLEGGPGRGESTRSEAMEGEGQGVPVDAWASEALVPHPQTPTSGASPRRGEGTWERLSAGGRTSMDPGASPSHPRIENAITIGDEEDDPRCSVAMELSKLPKVKTSGDASSAGSRDPADGASAPEGRADRRRRGKAGGGLGLETDGSPTNGISSPMPSQPLTIDLSGGASSPPSSREGTVAANKSGRGTNDLGNNKVGGARNPQDDGAVDLSSGGVEGRSRGERRGGDLEGEGESPRGEEGSTWTCKVCTLENEKRARACAVCRTPKLAGQASQALERQQTVLAEGSGRR